MGPSSTRRVPPLPLARSLGFVLITVVAFVLDALTVIPGAADRTGSRWPLWLGWEPSVFELVPLMALVYAALLLRRNAPLVALAGVALLSVAFTLAETPALPMAGVLVCLYTAAALSRRREQAWLALGTALAAQVVGLLLFLGPGHPDLLPGVLVLGGISFSLWVFGRRDHHATLAAADLPDRLAEHGELAAAQERRRIARELHDIVAHSVSAMMMQAAGAKAVASAMRQDLDETERVRLETVERALATIENTGSQSMRELHRLLSVLRGDDASDAASTDTEPSSQPGVADIAPLVELTRQSGLVVEVHTAGPPVRLDPSVGLAAYRVVQESLTNAMKHGGRGAIVDIFQNWQPDSLQLQVRSRSGHEGTPPGSLGGGVGLYGLHERVELVGGTFESGWVGDEFVATAVLPLTPAPPEDRPGGGGPGRVTRLDTGREDTGRTGGRPAGGAQTDGSWPGAALEFGASVDGVTRLETLGWRRTP